jgi:hypothetical protein
MKMSVAVFCVPMPCGLVGRHQRFGGTYPSPEDGGSMLLRNSGVYVQVQTVLQNRRPRENFFTSPEIVYFCRFSDSPCVQRYIITVKYANVN